MISIEDAQRFIATWVTPLWPCDVELAAALGCVVAGDTVATEPVPGFANSSMDGFALQSADTANGAVTLRIVDSVMAGRPSLRTVESGEAVRIMTGASMPTGTDAVEMIEEVDVDDGASTVSIHRSVEQGTFVRLPGDDIEVGDVLVRVGSVLHASRIGVLASQGLSVVSVHPRPRVGVLSTGDEISSAPGPLPVGAIRDVNRPMLLALLKDMDVTPVDLGTVSDRYDDTVQALRRAAGVCDAVITTGGVSVGDVDFVKAAIGELGGESARSLQVAVRPGKPFAFGCVGDRRVPVFGLPGNPVSTRVSFELFVRPSVRRLGGHTQVERMTADAITDVVLSRTPDGKTHMVHVDVEMGDDGRVHIVRAMRQGSHLLHAVAAANAIAVVPDGDGSAAGEVVRVMVLRPDELTSPSERA